MADTPTSAETLRARHAMPPTDPNIHLPREVREQGKRAEIIQQALIGQAEPSVLPPEAPPTTNGQAGPALPPQAPPPQTPPPADPEANVPPEEWRNRYLAMKGRHDRLNDQVGVLGERMQRIE